MNPPSRNKRCLWRSAARLILLSIVVPVCQAEVTTTPASPSAEGAASESVAIAVLVAKGRSQYLAGDLDAAARTFQTVAAEAPANEEAKRFLTRLASERRTPAMTDREVTRRHLLEDVTTSWRRPVPRDEDVAGAEPALPASPLARKLQEIMLPSISFTRTEIRQVLAALAAVAAEFDSTGLESKGVNFVLIDPANQAPVVTLALRNTTLKRPPGRTSTSARSVGPASGPHQWII